MKASTSAAILAFCVGFTSAAPVRQPNLEFNDDRWPPKGQDEFGQPQVIPSNDPRLLGKREAQFDLKSLIPDFSKANPNDDSPFNPFDDAGLPGKRDAQFDLKSLIPDFSKANPNDDSPFNPFDDPGLPGKRDAQPLLTLPIVGDLGNLPVVGDLGNLPVVGKLPVVGDLLGGNKDVESAPEQQNKNKL